MVPGWSADPPPSFMRPPPSFSFTTPLPWEKFQPKKYFVRKKILRDFRRKRGLRGLQAAQIPIASRVKMRQRRRKWKRQKARFCPKVPFLVTSVPPPPPDKTVQAREVPDISNT